MYADNNRMLLAQACLAWLTLVQFYDAVQQRRASFISNPPFNQLFLVAPGDADYFTQRCLESVISLPSLMEEADRLDTTRFMSAEERRGGQVQAARLLHLALRLDQHLQRWLAEAQETLGSPSQLGVITLQTTTRPLGFRPTRLHYGNSEASDAWALYWSISIYVHELIAQIHRRYISLSAGVPESGPLPPELATTGKDRATLNAYAENICGTVFSAVRSCPFTVHGTIVAMYTAQWYYKRHDEMEKLRWCAEVLKLLQLERIALGDKANNAAVWCSVVFSEVLSDEEDAVL